MRRSAAFDALCRCGRAWLAGAETVTLSPPDWDVLLGRARHERLTPVLHALFARARVTPVPPARFVEALAQDHRASLGRSLLRLAALEEVVARLQGQGIQTMVLKGLSLAETLYGDPALRPMDDVDLLVSRHEARAVRDVLSGLGYAAPSFEDDVRRRAATEFVPAGPVSTRPVIDLHWTLVDDKSGPAAWRWAAHAAERSRTVTLGHATVGALAPADALVHACLHLVANHGLGGLLWYCDIALMLDRWGDEIDPDAVVDAATTARVAGAVAVALAGACDTLGAPVPPALVAALRRRSIGGALLAHRPVIHRLARRPVPFQDYVVPLLMLDHPRDAAWVVARRLGAARRESCEVPRTVPPVSNAAGSG
ncbi:MAG: nucleotidyltransferase family protein [Candidatus Rokubacteria bacterium]|nr:nucleotidyltransferase family protein [Candidatus Rokubacteria bacterium]